MAMRDCLLTNFHRKGKERKGKEKKRKGHKLRTLFSNSISVKFHDLPSTELGGLAKVKERRFRWPKLRWPLNINDNKTFTIRDLI